MHPLSLGFLYSHRVCKDAILAMEDGTLPDSLQRERPSTRRLEKLPSQAGTVPVNKLLPICKSSRLLRACHESGIVPESLLLVRYRVLSCVNLDKEGGRVPVSPSLRRLMNEIRPKLDQSGTAPPMPG